MVNTEAPVGDASASSGVPSAALDAEKEYPVSGGMIRRALVSGTLGSALEWFDFAIYGALSATVFPALFFQNLGAAGGLIASFATFGVGFAARPLGAFVCGYLGDRFGRRPVLLGTFIAMGLASVLIGLLPAHQGALIASFLVILRFVQGFALGGESTGSQLMAMEHSGQSRRGIYGALMNAGSPLSQVIANLLLTILSATMTTASFTSWGWRIPFYCSIVLVVVGLYIRVRLDETPAFKVQKTVIGGEKPNGLKVLATQPLTVVNLILVWAGSAMTFYVIGIYGLSYMTSTLHYTQGQGFLMLVLGNAVAVLGGLAGGWVSDRIGRKPVLWIGLIAQLLGILAFFPVAATGSYALTLLVATVALTGVQFAFGAQPALFAEQFPTATRFSGSALALTISNLIFSAPAPTVAAALAAAGAPLGIGYVNAAVCALSMIVLIWTKENNRVDLATFVVKEA